MIKVKLNEIQVILGNNVEIKVGYFNFKVDFLKI